LKEKRKSVQEVRVLSPYHLGVRVTPPLQNLRKALHSDKVQPPIDFVDWENSCDDEDMGVWRALRHPLWSAAWGDA
jgi:hypothetical protein